MKKTIGMAAVMLLLAAGMATAQDEVSMADIAKTQASGGQIPDGIVFRTILDGLYMQQMNGESQDVVGYLARGFGVDEAEATTLFNMFLSVRSRMEQEKDLAVRTHACSAGEAYALLEQMYDIEEEVADRFYRKTRRNLDRRLADRFDAWIEKRRKGMRYTRIDHRKADQMLGNDSLAYLTSLCTGVSQ